MVLPLELHPRIQCSISPVLDWLNTHYRKGDDKNDYKTSKGAR